MLRLARRFRRQQAVTRLDNPQLNSALASYDHSRMHSDADLDAIWRYATRHRALLVASDAAGCFHCGAIFRPDEVTEWIDEPPALDGRAGPERGITAACPRCTMDAVLPSAAVSLNAGLLAAMAARYFGGQFRPATNGRAAG